MRLIDADAVIRQIGKLPYGKMSHDELSMLFHICDMINDAPTIDAEPVRHGEWVKDHSYTRKNHEIYYCTVCNHWQKCSIKMPSMNVLHMKYCPYCGAKMDAKEDEP